MTSMTQKMTGAAAMMMAAALLSSPAVAEDAKAPALFAGTDAMPAEMLDTMRGRNTIDIDALLDAELAFNDFTGAVFPVMPINDITDSFNNSSGIVTVIQNNGNGVIIQTATIVSVSFVNAPAP